MDFHSLSRKELQALCKKNKIPANMTNVAMADALKSLDKVEGLDELMNAPISDPQQSPGKTTNPEPRTASRTSTRRKPINVEPESSQLLTRTGRTTRSTSVQESEQENKNANILETPTMPTSRRRVPVASARRKICTQLIEIGEDEKSVGEGKNDVPETPAIKSSCRKTPAVSTRRKMEKNEKSIQRAYGTRHSVRLLEKSLADLCLKEERTVEAVKIEEMCEETELVEQKKDAPGGDSEIVESIDNEDKMQHEVQEENETKNDGEVAGNAKLDIGSEICTKLDSHSGLDEEDKDDDSSGESLLQGETSEKVVDTISEPVCENGPDVVTTENLETVAAALGAEIEKELTDNQDSLIEEVSDDSFPVVIGTENILTVNVSDEVSGESVRKNEVVINENLETATIEKELIDNNPDSFIEEKSDVSSPAVIETENILTANASDEVSVEVVDLPIPKITEVEGEVSVDVMDLSEFVGESSEMNLIEDEQHASHDMHSDAANEEDSDGNDVEEESDGYESDDSPENNNGDVIQNEKSEIRSENEGIHGEKCKETSDRMEDEHSSLYDFYVIEAKESSMITQGYCSSSYSDSTPGSVKQNSPFCPLVSNSEVPVEELAPASEPIQTLEKSPSVALVSGNKSTGGIASSPFAPGTIQGQFPRPTEPTPRKSSSKKLAAVKKMIFADINKENIDSIGRKVELRKEKAKKNDLEDKSLTQLKKMWKEKLQIANKNNEESDISKVVTRPALKVLPENCLAAAEQEEKN